MLNLAIDRELVTFEQKEHYQYCNSRCKHPGGSSESYFQLFIPALTPVSLMEEE
jgi:hypothetical protein